MTVRLTIDGTPRDAREGWRVGVKECRVNSVRRQRCCVVSIELDERPRKFAGVGMLGGEVIRGFSCAMVFGVIIGTYSSIYISAPTLIYLNIRPTPDAMPTGLVDNKA